MSDETTPQDGDAMSPASAGSHGPALWALEWKEDAGRIDPEWVYSTCDEAMDVNETGCYGRATVVPLYRSPTLTDEEREAIQDGIDALCTMNEDDAAMPLRALLKRLG